MKNILKILLLILPIIFLSTTCETNNGLEIPYVRVEKALGIYSDLQGILPGQSINISGGVNGLVVYCEDEYTYHVYDRTCTLWPDHNEAVLEDEEFDGVYTCPDCKSQYLLQLNADPISGPAVFGLKEYYAYLEGDILRVHN